MAAPSAHVEARLSLHDVIKMLIAPVPHKRSRAGVSDTSPWLAMREAMPVAGKLYAHGDVTHSRLTALSAPLLEELGIQPADARRKTLAAISAALDSPDWTLKLRPLVGGAAGPSATSAPTKPKRAFSSKAMATVGNATTPHSASSTPPRKRKRDISPETLARDWGDASFSPDTHTVQARPNAYIINEVMDLYTLRGRSVVVNRAPVLTAWAMVVLEKMGFERDEALSLAQCYVSHTSTARGRAIGVLPKQARAENLPVGVGTNQPHSELMGIKLPVMQIQDGEEDGEEETKRYRGISEGQMILPDRAWEYLQRSFMSNLPFVVGAMTLLADAIVEDGPGDPDPERLNRVAWRMYVDFRPDTGGEWGKRATLSISKILSLRPHAEDETEKKEIEED